MAVDIIYTDGVMFGDTSITSIKVLPINFVSFAKVWSDVLDEARADRNVSTNALMQRARIKLQAQFLAGDKRVAPDQTNIAQLPIRVAKQIVGSLDEGEGPGGSLLNDADGISVPLHYKLGTPLSIVQNGKKVEIGELEFQAKVYADIEDVLATDGDVLRALALIRKTATPVGSDLSLTSLPSWAVDRLTVGDGVSILKLVLPRFLE